MNFSNALKKNIQHSFQPEYDYRQDMGLQNANSPYDYKTAFMLNANAVPDNAAKAAVIEGRNAKINTINNRLSKQRIYNRRLNEGGVPGDISDPNVYDAELEHRIIEEHVGGINCDDSVKRMMIHNMEKEAKRVGGAGGAAIVEDETLDFDEDPSLEHTLSKITSKQRDGAGAMMTGEHPMFKRDDLYKGSTGLYDDDPFGVVTGTEYGAKMDISQVSKRANAEAAVLIKEKFMYELEQNNEGDYMYQHALENEALVGASKYQFDYKYKQDNTRYIKKFDDQIGDIETYIPEIGEHIRDRTNNVYRRPDTRKNRQAPREVMKNVNLRKEKETFNVSSSTSFLSKAMDTFYAFFSNDKDKSNDAVLQHTKAEQMNAGKAQLKKAGSDNNNFNRNLAMLNRGKVDVDIANQRAIKNKTHKLDRENFSSGNLNIDANIIHNIIDNNANVLAIKKNYGSNILNKMLTEAMNDTARDLLAGTSDDRTFQSVADSLRGIAVSNRKIHDSTITKTMENAENLRRLAIMTANENSTTFKDPILYLSDVEYKNKKDSLVRMIKTSILETNLAIANANKETLASTAETDKNKVLLMLDHNSKIRNKLLRETIAHKLSGGNVELNQAVIAELTFILPNVDNINKLINNSERDYNRAMLANQSISNNTKSQFRQIIVNAMGEQIFKSNDDKIYKFSPGVGANKGTFTLEEVVESKESFRMKQHAFSKLERMNDISRFENQADVDKQRGRTRTVPVSNETHRKQGAVNYSDKPLKDY